MASSMSFMAEWSACPPPNLLAFRVQPQKSFSPQCLHELSYEEEGLDQWILRSMTKAQAENYRARGGGDNPSRAQTRN